jgi:threonine/homoserine/homoserine lactone efflux protein
MLSKFAKLSLVATSLAPIFLTLWFVDFSRRWAWSDGLIYLASALVLTLICGILLSLSKSRLEKLPVEITSVRTAEKEMVGFVLVYLLPLINESSLKINPKVLVFVVGLFFVVILTSYSYHFNPLVGFLGYHFYEATVSREVSYVLISRKNIRHCKNIKKVVHISEYMIMEA